MAIYSEKKLIKLVKMGEIYEKRPNLFISLNTGKEIKFKGKFTGYNVLGGK